MYLKADKEVVCHLQAAVRMHACRSLFRRQQGAAVLVQSSVRRMQHRSRFLQVQSVLCSSRSDTQGLSLEHTRQSSYDTQQAYTE